ncbi:MAG: DUF637 domain-containing protein, partial [Hydrogenophaga sp.]|uniref:DUF637 domain-containing protein n=1 Tax=Hydrogenophaga sp. TaxID=1904254 RepID=UPI002614D5B3
GVRNQDGAVIAARESLAIAAGAIHNTEGALLLSAGDMALSASERLENRSASIEALGQLDLRTPVLVNANDHFETRLVPVEGPTALSLIQPSGSSARVPVSRLVWEAWQRAGQYRYDTSPDPHAGVAPVLGKTPIPELGQVSCSDPDNEASCVRVPGADYPANDPAWAWFKLAAPSPEPPLPEPVAPLPEQPVLAPQATPAQRAAHEQALLAYQAALAQHRAAQAARTAWETWDSQTEALYAELDARIEAYNQGFASHVIRDWSRFDIQRTVSQTQVVRSEPGRITAGGDLSLQGQDLLNADSEIVAGGALRGDLHRLVNRATPGERVVQDSGTVHSSWVFSRRGGKLRLGTKRWYRDTSASAPYAPPADVSSVDLNVARLIGQTGTAPSPALALPSGALFAPVADPSARHLLETDPRFADHRQWLSSDFMLQALATDPDTVHQRLGDGFIEQRLVREQLGALTGQRFLGDFSSDEAQFRALMSAGVTFAQAHQLRPGVSLSAAQVAQLTSDIVWLETQTVTLADGQTQQALVPRVYLLPRAADLSPDGALMAGRELQLELDGDAINSGQLSGRRVVRIDAQNIHHLGGKVSAQVVDLDAQQDIANIGGRLNARDALRLNAGRDIVVDSTTTTASSTAGASRFERTALDRVAGLYVSGEAATLVLNAGRDIRLKAAVLENAGTGDTVLLAGRNLSLGTVTTGSEDNIHWNAHTRLRVDQRRETGTSIRGGGDVVQRAGQDITARAAQVQAAGELSSVAVRNNLVEAGDTTLELDEARRSQSRGAFSSKTTTTQITHRSAQAQASELQGRSVEVLGTNVVTVGANLQGRDSVHVEGTDQTLLLATQDRSVTQVEVQTRRRVAGISAGKRESTDTVVQNTSVGTELISDQAVRIGVGERTELIGARVEAPAIGFSRSEHAAPGAAGELLLGGAVDQDVHSHQSKTVTAAVWQKTVSRGHETETLKPTELHGELRFDPGLAISAQLPQGPLREQIGQLVQQPGLAYLGELAGRDDIDWQAIELAQRQWHDEQQGLTGAGAALLSLAVGYLTLGMGTSIVGTTTAAGTTTAGGVTLATTTAGVTTTTAAGAALNAGFTSLASTAAVSFVNHGGDLGAVFKDLGSSASVKQLVTGMLTASAVTRLGNQIHFGGKPLARITVKDGFTAHLSKTLIEQSAGAAIHSAITGASLQDSLQAALINSLITSSTAVGANAIGDLGLQQDGSGRPVLNPAGKALLHALVGCAGAAVQNASSGCAAGASGAVLGELAAAWLDPNGHKPREETEAFAAAVGGLGGVLAGDESGVGVNLGAQAGRNAAANNYLNHVRPNMLRLSEVEQYERAASECGAGDVSACARRDDLVQTSRERDRELQQACGGATPVLCSSLSAEARAMGSTVLGQPGQFVYANSPNGEFDLNVVTVGPVTPNPALRQNFHIQLAQSTSQGLLFALPGPEDVAMGALLLTAPGKMLAEVVVQGGQKLLRFADGVVAPVGSAEAKLLAEARIKNNHYADGGIADPLRPVSVLGSWTPAAELTARHADELIAMSLPWGSRVTGLRPADAANAAAKASGFGSPFVPGSSIVEIEIEQGAKFVRVFGGDSPQGGTWIMRADDVVGLTPQQIASKYALPQVPTKITDVRLPSGVKIEASVAGAISPNASQGVFTGDNGGGGGVQFQIRYTGKLPSDWFVNERPLP